MDNKEHKEGYAINNTIKNNYGTNNNSVFNNNGPVHFNTSSDVTILETEERNYFNKEEILTKGQNAYLRFYSLLVGAALSILLPYLHPKIELSFININLRDLPISLWWLSSLICIIFFLKNLGENDLAMEIWKALSPKNKTEARIKDKIYTKQGDSICEEKKSAKCIYPYCNGKVILADPPIREKNNHQSIGVCDIDPHNHTYRVDKNYVLYKCPIDWRELDNNQEARK